MASTIKVDNVQNTPGTNIVSKCGTDVTLGASGDTVALACGASQTGFGRTGTVDWVTTPKVTGDSPITAVTGKGYFLNTTAGAITINLPAGAAGSIVSMADYAATWQTNNVTVSPNGAEKIGAVAANAVLSTEGQSVTFVYVDSTQGWVNTMDSTSNVRGQAPYIVATGGTPCTGAIVCTDYKVHTFTGPGTFCVSYGGAPGGSTTVDYMVVAGGGSGSYTAGCTYSAAGGGAGGYRESSGTASGCYTASPLGSGVAALPVSATGYPIVVGGGGATVTVENDAGNRGSNSSFSTITSTGGGGGRRSYPPVGCSPGGSGGGGGALWGPAPTTSNPGGAGNTPPFSPPQGNPGGTAPDNNNAGGGGGGATAVGGNSIGNVPPNNYTGGAGGAGATSSIDATPTARAGGGGGNGVCTPGAASPCATGGKGGTGPGPAGSACAGATNKGGGGGGAQQNNPSGGAAGGSGVVIIRYKFQ